MDAHNPVPVSDLPAGPVPARLAASLGRAHRLQEERRADAGRTEMETRATQGAGGGTPGGRLNAGTPRPCFL